MGCLLVVLGAVASILGLGTTPKGVRVQGPVAVSCRGRGWPVSLGQVMRKSIAGQANAVLWRCLIIEISIN